MDDQKIVANSNYALLLHLIPSFVHTRSLLVRYAYVSMESTDYSVSTQCNLINFCSKWIVFLPSKSLL